MIYLYVRNFVSTDAESTEIRGVNISYHYLKAFPLECVGVKGEWKLRMMTVQLSWLPNPDLCHSNHLTPPQSFLRFKKLVMT